jgi:hypothetical protein
LSRIIMSGLLLGMALSVTSIIIRLYTGNDTSMSKFSHSSVRTMQLRLHTSRPELASCTNKTQVTPIQFNLKPSSLCMYISGHNVLR